LKIRRLPLRLVLPWPFAISIAVPTLRKSIGFFGGLSLAPCGSNPFVISVVGFVVSGVGFGIRGSDRIVIGAWWNGRCLEDLRGGGTGACNKDER
jgi:hypothetical protein